MSRSTLASFGRSPSMLRQLLLLALLALASCKSMPVGFDPELGAVERDNAGLYLERAEAELADGKLWDATLRLIGVRKTRGLVPEDLYHADLLLNQAAEGLFQAAQAADTDGEDMGRLYQMDLPIRLRATAGLIQARKLFENGHQVLAYRAVTDVEKVLPNHPMRDMAAETLMQTGSYMLAEEGNYNFLFSYKVKGAAALEFLVDHYGGTDASARAYALLAAHYEDLGELKIAQQRWEDLILYHGEDPLVPEAASRMPYLRLERLKRSDYDRTEMQRAKQEIERWLSYYPDLEQADWMRQNLSHCNRMLAENDLVVARFYVQIDAATGARLHADRALLEAEAAGAGDLKQEVEELLARLPARTPEAIGVESASAAGSQ